MSRREFMKKVGVGVAGTGVILGELWRRDSRHSSTQIPDDVPRHTANGLNDTAAAGDQPQAETQTTDSGWNTYYVSPSGDDSNPGTQERPLATVESAAASVAPGDTIYLRGGTYNRTDTVEISSIHGSKNAQITLAGYPGERPVFSFDGPRPGGWNAPGGIEFTNVRFWSVRNLTVRNSRFIGFRVASRSRNNEFENVRVYNNNLIGFAVQDRSSNNVIRNLVSANNFDPQNGGADADGMAVKNSDGNTIVNCKFYYNSDDGLDLWQSRSAEVRNCLSWDNGRGENGDGNGFKLGGTQKAGGHRVVRNLSFTNRRAGFNDNSASIPIEVYNNTAWSNSSNYQFFSANHELVNNISHDGSVRLESPVNHHDNTWNLGIEKPEFASYYPNSERFLRLSEGSPCIDSGVDVGLKYTGDAPDLGAYEYGT